MPLLRGDLLVGILRWRLPLVIPVRFVAERSGRFGRGRT
jgi:hypothetical protein